MENIRKSAQYVLAKKEYQLDKLQHFHSTSNEDIYSYIHGKKSRGIIGLKLERISNWQHWKFIHSFLNEEKVDNSLLALSTYYAVESVAWDFFLGKDIAQYAESAAFHDAVKHLAQALLLGWESLAVRYGKLLLNMLYGKQYKGWHPSYKHPWFMLEVFCRWQGIKLDYSRLNYPEDMGVYAQELEHWDTDNQELLSRLVNELVDFHIAESDENEHKDHTPDFPSSDYFIYPVEILLWLNIRERMGLTEYIADNDLMKMPINNWHTQQVVVPVIGLVEQAKMKLQSECPNTRLEL
ncbi:hypothetical protein [Prevotella fusca]|uniref:Uncharacterized protein n=1 Tax=Prevotella fusca JCM 17724 TaxID=1236517 RepID=A0A0K1NN24_9BACT|nr:hypothetical protein [Prevotella fusca]AKU70487.1 hypothetical protein ADJ77_12090 [Prevotella fusca JCM 17724]QUB86121.1 hypothetical protein J5A51_02320 [Prevotella fusca JCM 17724]